MSERERPAAAADPPATVVIPTRQRGNRVVDTVRSVLVGTAQPAAVLVVDQSEDDRTAVAMEPLLADGPVQYVRTRTRGIAAALNLGIEQAETDCIAITGDDCAVAPAWLHELLRELCTDRATGIVFGTVLPGRENDGAGFMPAYAARHTVARTIRQKHRVGGTSQCMALRRSMWDRLGGFDEMLGVGAPLQSAEDADLTIRALLSGYAVRETPRAAVTHHGYYSYGERRLLIHRNWYGTGAAFAKALRIGPVETMVGVLRVGWSWANGGSRVAAGLGVGPHRLVSLAAFAQGAWVGLRLPVDRDRGRFRVAAETRRPVGES